MRPFWAHAAPQLEKGSLLVGSLLSQTSVYDPHYQDLYSNATSPLKARLYVLFFFNVFWQLLRRSKSLRNRSTAQLPEEKTIADQLTKWPFDVWTETPEGGITNFITGAGGFLQTV